MDEGKVWPNGLTYHKFGYVALRPGASLKLTVDTSMAHADNPRDKVGRIEASCRTAMHVCPGRDV